MRVHQRNIRSISSQSIRVICGMFYEKRRVLTRGEQSRHPDVMNGSGVIRFLSYT